MPSARCCTKRTSRLPHHVRAMFILWGVMGMCIVNVQTAAGAFMIYAPSTSRLERSMIGRRTVPRSIRSRGRASSLGRSGHDHGKKPGKRTVPPATMLFEKRPEEKALGDRIVREELPGTVGVAAEPPGFLKRLFSVPKNVRRTVAAGDVIVPVIGARDGWGGIRQNLANRGIYPGVEYRILEISMGLEREEEQQDRVGREGEEGKARGNGGDDGPASEQLGSAKEAPEGAFDDGKLVFTMRPVYPLVKRLERPWPVQVPAREFPVMLTPFSYNAATAWAALTTSLSTLAVGFVLSQALTISVIPSHSMEPTLQVNDVVLVEKVSRASLIRRNDIVFFSPPPALRQAVADVGGTLTFRDLFVKRIVALPGDVVTVNTNGEVKVADSSSQKQRRLMGSASTGILGASYVEENAKEVGGGSGGSCSREEAVALPDSVLRRIRTTDGAGEVVQQGSVFVLGDNPASSMDSRVWGQLEQREIVGHPLLRIFPFGAFGPLR